MLTVVATILTLVLFRYIHLVADRGSREHLFWSRVPLRYLEYIASLDRQGSVIRDAATVTNNMGMRKKIGIQAYTKFGLVVLVIILGSQFNWSPFVVAAVCAVLSNLGYLFERGILRTRGHIDYAVPYTIRQKTIIGIAVIAALTLSWVGFRTYISVAFGGPPWPIGDALMQWAIAIGSLLLTPATYVLVYRINNSLAPPNFAQSTDSSSVLLLRSFSDDKLRIRNSLHVDPFLGMLGTRATLEKCLADFLVGNGNLVAIGRPGERLPPLGALRTYWPDEQWQEAVRKTAALAQAVFLVAGSTRGLSWEVQQLKTLGLLSKTIFLIPPLPNTAAERRLEQLLNDLDAPEAAFAQIRDCIASTITAVRLTAEGKIVLHLSDGRDWSSYLGTSTYFLGELDGKIRPPAAGELARVYFGDTQ